MRRPDIAGWLTWRAAAALAVIALAGVLWAALAPLPAGSREVVYVIPPGTAARQAAGENPAVFPQRMRFTIGVRDVLVIRNDDDREATFGPVLLAPGQTYRVPFRNPAEFQLACSVHRGGEVAVVVVPAPAPGLARLRWRLDDGWPPWPWH